MKSHDYCSSCIQKQYHKEKTEDSVNREVQWFLTDSLSSEWYHYLLQVCTGIRLCCQLEELLFVHLVDLHQLVIFLNNDVFECLDLKIKKVHHQT